MTDRSSLHINKIVPFTIWLRKKGWQIVSTKGDYEVFRAKKDGEDTLIVFTRCDVREHVSLFQMAEKLFWKWKGERRKYRESPIRMNKDDQYCKMCSHHNDGNGAGRCKNCRCYTNWDGQYDGELILMRRVSD